ncbi:unnamed protein product [Pedinophyceae sp. YPF-701]|nr:unnamed protein product [Pedinophyceae sp. YPF-701]
MVGEHFDGDVGREAPPRLNYAQHQHHFGSAARRRPATSRPAVAMQAEPGADADEHIALTAVHRPPDATMPRTASPNHHGLTTRAVAAGIAVGSILCFSNTYFGLQTGWVTMGSLQSAILGFGLFSLAASCCNRALGFDEAENVVLQTSAVVTATMPLAAGLVSIVPALSMLEPADLPHDGHGADGGGAAAIVFGPVGLVLWTATLCLLGVFLAPPLRQQVIVREKLQFPSGTATANVIRVLHSHARRAAAAAAGASPGPSRAGSGAATPQRPPGALPHVRSAAVLGGPVGPPRADAHDLPTTARGGEGGAGADPDSTWRLLGRCFAGGFMYTVASHLPRLGWMRSFDVLGWVGVGRAAAWGWVLQPSAGYIGQGIIMGPRTGFSMLGGAVVAWAVVGPLVTAAGWARGDPGDWKEGAAGWLLWPAMAAMLGDTLTSLAIFVLKQAVALRRSRTDRWGCAPDTPSCSAHVPAPTPRRRQSGSSKLPGEKGADAQADDRGGEVAHVHPEVPTWVWVSGLAASTVLCVGGQHLLVGTKIYELVAAVAFGAMVSLLAVRALGETDINPVSGIGKLSQLVFAVLAPGNVVANLAAGAIAEAAATQAGEMMQDFRAAHLLGIAPWPQFVAMAISCVVSVPIACAAYSLCTWAWQVPGPELPAPTAAIWLGMARLLSGGAMPTGAATAALIAGVLGSVNQLAHSAAADAAADAADRGTAGLPAAEGSLDAWGMPGVRVPTPLARTCATWLPSGVGAAAGAYLPARFTIPRVIGAAMVFLRSRERGPLRALGDQAVLVLASGLVLGEGIGALVVAVGRAATGNADGA